MFVPKWFIESIVSECDKEAAVSGRLKGKSSVLVRCCKCCKEFSVIVNSCVKTRNRFDDDHKLYCRSCANRKEDLYYGAKFGDLTVLGIDDEDGSKTKCRCNCGNIVSVFTNNLRSGRTTSCGNHKNLDVSKSLYCECISIFEEFLKSLDVSYFKDVFCDDLNCFIDFVVVCEQKEIYVKFYGEYTVRLNEIQPKELFISASESCKRLVSIFINDYISSHSKLNLVFKDILCRKQRVYARECVLKEVSKQAAYMFFDANHIQGGTHSATLNYGLFYGDELFAVMGFGSANYHSMKTRCCNEYFDNSRYELHRYAVKTNFIVVGGYSKLLAHFEREKSPSYLLSYSANDWFNGAMYESMGFKFCGLTQPRYYWVKGDEVLNREKCQSKKLCELYPELYQESLDVNAGNKEDFVMSKLGFTKVYSSGTKKWEKFYF